MSYKPAELNGDLVNQLQQFEQDLQKQTSGNIVVIAYEYEPDGEKSQA
ncbi:hypothetical protein ACFPYJ_29400 [Paenibacillus solisilvae]|uniref:Uncharacterized protein n=1 Tax=Paenibacillus solisilvae TaxID=2486751 RepID=A0ABW0W8Y8_9BACL